LTNLVNAFLAGGAAAADNGRLERQLKPGQDRAGSNNAFDSLLNNVSEAERPDAIRRQGPQEAGFAARPERSLERNLERSPDKNLEKSPDKGADAKRASEATSKNRSADKNRPTDKNKPADKAPADWNQDRDKTVSGDNRPGHVIDITAMLQAGGGPWQSDGHDGPDMNQPADKTGAVSSGAAGIYIDKNGESAPRQADPGVEQLVDGLAKSLGLSGDDISRILASLGMEPGDLAQDAKLSKFMQAALGADSPGELLNVPGMSGIMRGVGESIARYAAQKPGQSADNTQAAAQAGDASVSAAADAPPEASQLTDGRHNGGEGRERRGDASGGQNAAAAMQSKQSGQSAQSVIEAAAAKMNASGAGARFMINQVNAAGAAETNMLSIAGQAAQTGQTADIQAGPDMKAALFRADSDLQDVVNQVMESMKAGFRDGRAEIRVRLSPDNLGDVSLKVTAQNGIVTAHFTAESRRVKETLESNFDGLRDVLRQQGVQIENISVSVRQDAPGGQSGQSDRGQRLSDAGTGHGGRQHNNDEFPADEPYDEPRAIDASAILLNSVEYAV